MQEPGRIAPATLDVLDVLANAEDDPHGFAIADRAKPPGWERLPDPCPVGRGRVG
jgi:hypothetical protein